MEKDKKYNVILGLMIFLFIIFVGLCIAWGLGYVQFGKQKPNSDVIGKDTNISNENKGTSNSEDVLKKAYEKYNFEWISKKNNTITYVENGTVKAEINEKVFDVSFDYGTAKYSCPLPGHDFQGVTVINDKGEAYIGEFENEDLNIIKYTKVNTSKKIVDVCLAGDDASVPYSGPYYMTEDGTVINKNGNSYEEVNKNHITYVGDALSTVYVCDDNTLDIPMDNSKLTSYTKVVDNNKNNVSIKQVFFETSSSSYYIIAKDNMLYKLSNIESGIVSAVNSKTVKSVTFAENSYQVTINFTDNTKTVYDQIYSFYDIANKNTK